MEPVLGRIPGAAVARSDRGDFICRYQTILLYVEAQVSWSGGWVHGWQKKPRKEPDIPLSSPGRRLAVLPSLPRLRPVPTQKESVHAGEVGNGGAPGLRDILQTPRLP